MIAIPSIVYVKALAQFPSAAIRGDYPPDRKVILSGVIVVGGNPEDSPRCWLRAEVLVRSERQLFETLTTDLSVGQRLELDTLLRLRGSSKVRTFTWLRSPPGAPTSQNVLLHIERLQHIRSLELRSDLGQLIY